MDRHALALEILNKGTVIPANPLVLNEKREFDERRQRVITRYYMEAGSGGIAVAVHTTQFEIREKKHNLFERVIKTVVDEIESYEKESGRTIVRVCGVCGETEQAKNEALLAKSLGYDAVLLSPGGLNSYNGTYRMDN